MSVSLSSASSHHSFVCVCLSVCRSVWSVCLVCSVSTSLKKGFSETRSKCVEFLICIVFFSLCCGVVLYALNLLSSSLTRRGAMRCSASSLSGLLCPALHLDVCVGCFGQFVCILINSFYRFVSFSFSLSFPPSGGAAVSLAPISFSLPATIFHTHSL